MDLLRDNISSLRLNNDKLEIYYKIAEGATIRGTFELGDSQVISGIDRHLEIQKLLILMAGKP